MKIGLTYIIFVIDRSGSMGSIRDDMIGGFNAFIEAQKKLPGECKVFAYKFDDSYEPIFEDLDINQVPSLNRDNYVPHGWTALYDSLGKTIVDIGAKLSALKEEDRPEKVLFVTITDGEDNRHLQHEDAIRYDAAKVKKMVDHQTNNYKWNFAYIGANQDAWAVGGSMGVAAAASLNYTADSIGTAYAFSSLSDSTSTYRKSCGSDAKFAFDKKDEKKANA